MFVLDQNPEFTRTVKVKVPANGGFEEQSFKARFRVVPIEESENFDLTTTEGSTAFLRRALVNVDELSDKEKQTIIYNDAVRDQLLGLPYVRQAVYREYHAAIRGEASGN